MQGNVLDEPRRQHISRLATRKLEGQRRLAPHDAQTRGLAERLAARGDKVTRVAAQPDFSDASEGQWQRRAGGA